MNRLEALTAAIESAEQQIPWQGERDLWFGVSVGDWYVQVAFDGFANLYNEKTGERRNGRVPEALLPRVKKLLPGLPPPAPDEDDMPF
jgi:hypothetical protein